MRELNRKRKKHTIEETKKTEFNLFADYPYKLTADQLKLFNKENPFWANFFSKRLKEVAK